MDNPSTGRLLSLDVLRGFDMLFIMGGGPLAIALCTALGASDCELARQFVHVEWDGLRFEDTIFPLFLFLAGVSWPFSLAKRRERGDSRSAIVRKILSRGLLLVLFGFLYNGLLKFDFANMVWGAVLTRIGIAWAVAAALSVFIGIRGRVLIAASVLTAYWAVSVLVTAPDAPWLDPLTAKGCFAGWVDRLLLPGKLTQPGVISNQGILSTVPAVVTAMFGVFAGELLRRGDLSGARKTAALALGAVALVALGCLVAFGLGRFSAPFNKILWSSSFTLAVGGYSAGMLALFYWLIDVRKVWRHTLFFRVIGLNSITIYLGQRILGLSAVNGFFFDGLAGLLPPDWGAVVQWLGYIAVCWGFLYFLYCRNVFLRV